MDAATTTIAYDVTKAITALAVVQTLGRFYIRWRSSGLYWDDFFNGLAALCLFTFVVLPSITNPSLNIAWKCIMALYMLTWAILWLVKASFLALYWNIFMVSPGFRKAWWLVMTYTFLSFWPLFLAPLWQCGSPLKYTDLLTCQAYTASEQALYASKAIYMLNLVLHISSELLILGLPLWFISKLQMSRIQKISAASFFCAVVFTIVLGFFCNLGYLCAGMPGMVCAGDGMKWLEIAQFGVNIEGPVAVFVCALPPYKILLSKIFKRGKALPEEQAGHRGNTLELGPQEVDSITELERGYV